MNAPPYLRMMNRNGQFGTTPKGLVCGRGKEFAFHRQDHFFLLAIK